MAMRGRLVSCHEGEFASQYRIKDGLIITSFCGRITLMYEKTENKQKDFGWPIKKVKNDLRLKM